MAKIRNVSAYGDLDVPLLRRVVPAGETVEVTADQAERLLVPADHLAPNFAPADDDAQAVHDRLSADAQDEARAELGMPDPSALKPAWVEWAESRGDTDAAHKTKQQLIDEHGTLTPGADGVPQ